MQHLDVYVQRVEDRPVLDLEEHVADVVLTLGVEVGHLAANHRLDDVADGDVILALFQHLDGGAGHAGR